MQKIWFVDIQGKAEGPFSLTELKSDDRITPDTYVWREGWEQWQRVRDVPDLSDLFKDDGPANETIDVSVEPSEVSVEDELAMDYRLEPPYLFWVLTALFIILYMIIQLWN